MKKSDLVVQKIKDLQYIITAVHLNKNISAQV